MPLTPSQRVTLLKKIAKELNRERRVVIDATLHQFSLPTADAMHGDDAGYILRMIDDAPDKTLLELAAHLGYSLTSKLSVKAPAFWDDGKLRLFISHLAKHKVAAGRLKRLLSGYGISCFVAHDDIAPTKEWEEEILAALDTCHCLIALMHPDFHKSVWADQEIGYAMGRGVPVCSVRLGQDPYGFIGRYQAFAGSDDELQDLALELYEAYAQDVRTESIISEAVIHMFEESESYARAKTLIALVEELSSWDTSYNSRLRKAVKNNRQVREAIGVPEAVERIAKKRSRDSDSE
jgi:hypothetical protein